MDAPSADENLTSAEIRAASFGSPWFAWLAAGPSASTKVVPAARLAVRTALFWINSRRLIAPSSPTLFAFLFSFDILSSLYYFPSFNHFELRQCHLLSHAWGIGEMISRVLLEIGVFSRHA